MNMLGCLILPVLSILIIIITIIILHQKKKSKNKISYILIIPLIILSLFFIVVFYPSFIKTYELNIEIESNEHEIEFIINFFNDWTLSSDAAGILNILIENDNKTVVWENREIEVNGWYSYSENIKWTEIYPEPNIGDSFIFKCWFKSKNRFQIGTLYEEKEFIRK